MSSYERARGFSNAAAFKPDENPIHQFNAHYKAAASALGMKPTSNQLLEGHGMGNHGHVAGNMADTASQLREKLFNTKNAYGHTVGTPLAHDPMAQSAAHKAVLGMEQAGQDYYRHHQGQGKGWD